MKDTQSDKTVQFISCEASTMDVNTSNSDQHLDVSVSRGQPSGPHLNTAVYIVTNRVMAPVIALVDTIFP
jgi:hypothetical protein